MCIRDSIKVGNYEDTYHSERLLEIKSEESIIGRPCRQIILNLVSTHIRLKMGEYLSTPNKTKHS